MTWETVVFVSLVLLVGMTFTASAVLIGLSLGLVRGYDTGFRKGWESCSRLHADQELIPPDSKV